MTGRSIQTANRCRWLRTAAATLGIVAASLALAIGFATDRVGAETSAPPADAYLGTDACTKTCHKQERKQFLADVHSKSDRSAPGHLKGCEACHGPAKAHKEAVDADDEDLKMQSPAKASGAPLTRTCAPCHSKTVNVVRFESTAHAGEGIGCRDCHAVHQDKPTDHKLKQRANELCLSCHKVQNAEFRANAHHPLFEGRIDCVDCHDPHGGAEPAMIKQDLDRLCTSCHPEKRGPFLYEHGPNVDQMEDGCLTCHKPHGSALDKLAKLSGRGLCVQCHTDIVTDGSHRDPRRAGTCWQNGCHARIHGSQNHPLFLF